MVTSITPARNLSDFGEPYIEFHPNRSDYGHFIVNYNHPERAAEIIGHVYLEVDGEDTYYISTNRKGREIFPRTTDFNSVSEKYERYAHLLEQQQRTRKYIINPLITNNLIFKNSNIMTTPTTQPQQKQKKINQLIFVEYEKPTKDGHFISVVDSYRNDIGRIYRNWNDELKKFEYSAYDHEGRPMSKSEKLWELKKEFTNDRENLLEDAHQRRIASKAQSQEVPNEKAGQIPPAKADERKNETENLRQNKKGREKENSKSPRKNGSNTKDKGNTSLNQEENQQQDREDELSDLRDDNEEHRRDTEMER